MEDRAANALIELDQARRTLINMFVELMEADYFEEENGLHWIAVCDMHLSLTDIEDFFILGMELDDFIEWYDATLDHATVYGTEGLINLKSWHMGLRFDKIDKHEE